MKVVDVNKLLDEIKVYATVSPNQHNLFTNEHIKYQITIKRGNKQFGVTYQQNKNLSKVNKNDILYSVIIDADCYNDCVNVLDFAESLGYDYCEEKTKVNKIFKCCEQEYHNLYKIFTEDEIDILREHFSEL